MLMREYIREECKNRWEIKFDEKKKQKKQKNALPLFLKDAVNLRVVLHHHAILHVGLGRRQAELDQADLAAVDHLRPRAQCKKSVTTVLTTV
jgi:hypothetical protein